ncbi:MAG TPA: type VI secretion system contractile sheath large subunit, partial [Polyangiaceae bacterium]|nr:type VI secretion system contractile sheath large subunit [Polyangiaceae bacterium]
MADSETVKSEGQLQTLEVSDFESLLQKEFRPQTDNARQEVQNAVRTLAEQALQGSVTVSDDVVQTIKQIIAEIDKKLAEQINVILHHADFQKLEGAWRGLHYLVNNTETDEMLKIRVLNVSKKDLHKTLKKFKGAAWDQSPIFKAIYEEEYGKFGGEPYGCLVGDYYFDHSAPDVELLGEMAKISAAAHAPFITGTASSLFQMQSWSELANPRDLSKIFETPEYAAWKSLRESEDSKYLGLALPRFLARRPYGAK